MMKLKIILIQKTKNSVFTFLKKQKDKEAIKNLEGSNYENNNEMERKENPRFLR